MSIARQIITSVFAGSVAGIVTGLIVKNQSKTNPVQKDTKSISAKVGNLEKDNSEDSHFFV